MNEALSLILLPFLIIYSLAPMLWNVLGILFALLAFVLICTPSKNHRE